MITNQVGDHNKMHLEFNVLNIKNLDEGCMLWDRIKTDVEKFNCLLWNCRDIVSLGNHKNYVYLKYFFPLVKIKECHYIF